MVFRRFVRKGDRANFRLGYMGGCVKKNRNTKMVCAAEKGKVKYRLHPLIHSFSSRKDATTCGGGSERAKVCGM
jgi:hypothetical protein